MGRGPEGAYRHYAVRLGMDRPIPQGRPGGGPGDGLGVLGGSVAAHRGRHHLAVVDVGGHRVEADPPRTVGETECVFFVKTGVMMNWHSYYTDGPNKRRRKAIPATCGVHRGPIGFANLLVSMQNGWIVLDPHVTGECVIALDEEGGKTLCDVVTLWLG